MTSIDTSFRPSPAIGSNFSPQGGSPAAAAPLDRSTETGAAASPAPRPTAESARNAFLRASGDSGAAYRAFDLQQKVGAQAPQGVPPPRPGTEATTDTGPDATGQGAPTIAQIREAARQSGDLSLLNPLDPFRQKLSDSDQQEYDRQLDDLRNDVRGSGNANGRIQFKYVEGANKDPVAEDMALRGILAGSFGREDLRNNVLNNALIKHGKPFEVHLDGRDTLGGNVAGYAFDGGMRLATGLNTDAGGYYAAHEFSHNLQDFGPGKTQRSGSFGTLPGDASQQEVNKFLGLYNRAYGAEVTSDPFYNAHKFVRANLDYHYDPAAFRSRSPELYAFMSDYFGWDPLNGGLNA